MGKSYGPIIYNRCKKQFVEENESPEIIAEDLKGKPSVATIRKWAKTKDRSGKDWYNYRENFKEQQYDAISPERLEKKLMDRIYTIASDEKLDSKGGDLLSKILKALKEVTDPSYQVHVMFAMLKEFIDHLKKYYPDLVTKELLESIRSYKDYKRSKLEGIRK